MTGQSHAVLYTTPGENFAVGPWEQRLRLEALRLAIASYPPAPTLTAEMILDRAGEFARFIASGAPGSGDTRPGRSRRG